MQWIFFNNSEHNFDLLCAWLSSAVTACMGGKKRSLSGWTSFTVGARVCRGALFDYLNHFPLRTHIPYLY